REFQKCSNDKLLYILDDAIPGLHEDVSKRLLDVLQLLVENVDPVVVIEHNLDINKAAGYSIDLDPEGGDGGGYVVTSGSPEDVSTFDKSYTGRYLKPVLERDKARMEQLLQAKEKPGTVQK